MVHLNTAGSAIALGVRNILSIFTAGIMSAIASSGVKSMGFDE
jgi:hypothetical protein